MMLCIHSSSPLLAQRRNAILRLELLLSDYSLHFAKSLASWMK